MERIPDIDQERVEYWRKISVDAALAGLDNDLPEEQRRSRPEVLPGSFVKRDDDILLFDCIPLHVVGPGRGLDGVLAYYPPWFGDDCVQFAIGPNDITDRAPADGEEDPMPAWPEEGQVP